MTTKHYHILAMGGWLLKIFSHVFTTAPEVHSFLNGFALGMITICYLTILIKKRKEQHEATAR